MKLKLASVVPSAEDQPRHGSGSSRHKTSRGGPGEFSRKSRSKNHQEAVDKEREMKVQENKEEGRIAAGKEKGIGRRREN